MPSLLIIGGTGFFGKSILSIFTRGGLVRYKINKVIILAREIDTFIKNHSELLSPSIEFIKGDIAKLTSLPNADYIIHAAASTNLADYNFDTYENIEKSILNFSRLVLVANKKSKILYCSSGAVYGKNQSLEKSSETDLFQDDLSLLSEEQKLYCLSKRFAENEIIKLGNLGLNVSIARCFAFSGKYLPRNQHYALGNFLHSAESGKTIEVKAEHPVIRSYMHADELAHSLINVVKESNQKCPIFNVGSQSMIELRDLARKVGLEYGVNVKVPAKLIKKNIDFYVPNVEKLNKLNYNNNISLIRELINQNPTVIIGSGIHKIYSSENNILNDWHLLISKLAEKFGYSLKNAKNRNLMYVFEDLIDEISLKQNMPAYKAENKLKKEICKFIFDSQQKLIANELKGKLDSFTKSQFISLNVDTLIVDNQVCVKQVKSSHYNSVFNTSFKLNDTPVFYVNGNITEHKYLRFGLRSISNQINIFQKGFEKLKNSEKLYNHNRDIIMSTDSSWVSNFFYKPVLILGASIGEHELGLRFLLNQRKRNFSFKFKFNNPIYIILDQKSIEIPGYREDLDTLGIQPIIFENYDYFWRNF